MPHDSDPGAPAPAPHVGPRCTPQEGLELAAVIGGGDWTLAWSAGEIVSTPADASRWMAVLGSGAVVDAEHLQLMTTPSPQSIAALQDMAACFVTVRLLVLVSFWQTTTLRWRLL